MEKMVTKETTENANIHLLLFLLSTENSNINLFLNSVKQTLFHSNTMNYCWYPNHKLALSPLDGVEQLLVGVSLYDYLDSNIRYSLAQSKLWEYSCRMLFMVSIIVLYVVFL
jgi:hypothetical protein